MITADGTVKNKIRQDNRINGLPALLVGIIILLIKKKLNLESIEHKI